MCCHHNYATILSTYDCRGSSSDVCIPMQASFQLLVQAIDEDTGNPDDFIDVLVVDMPLSPSPSPTPPSTYTSNGVVFSFVISFQVECSESECVYVCIVINMVISAITLFHCCSDNSSMDSTYTYYMAREL